MSTKRIEHILTKKVISVSKETRITDALRLMRTANISSILVLEYEKAIGIFTERDVVRCIAQQNIHLSELSIGDVMSRNVLTAQTKTSLFEAFQRLTSNKIRHLVVTDDQQRVVGIVTQSDMVMHLGYEYFVKVKSVSQMMSKHVISIGKEHSVQEASCLMADRKVSFLVIQADNIPIGILTERDITRLAISNADLELIRVEEVMNSPVITLSQDAPAYTAAEVMRSRGIRRLVLVDNQNLIAGVVTQTDMIRGMESKYIESLKTVIKDQNSELNRAVQQLSQKTLYLDSILNSSIDMGYVATNRDQEIVYYNPTAADFLGCPIEQIIGRNLYDVHQALGLQPKCIDRIFELIRDDQTFIFDFHPTLSNADRHIQARVSGIRENQEIVGLVLMLIDITNKRKAEEIENKQRQELEQQKAKLQVELIKQEKISQALRESEKRFRRISSLISDIAYSCSSEANRSFSINWVAGAVEKICGYSVAEIIAQRCWRFLVIEDDLALFDENVIDLIPGSHRSCNLRIRHKDGTVIWVSSHAECTKVAGSLDSSILYGCLVDITESKRVEEEHEKLEAHINQTQKMESVGRLAGGVAHDFNNMLGVILGYTQMALDETDSNSLLHHHLQQVMEAAQRSASVTKQLLGFARKQPVAPKVLNLNEAIEQGLLQMLRRLIGENIDLSWKPTVNLWTVKIDPSQIDQILANLCVNARDAINGVGKITIETGKVSLDELYCANHPGARLGEYVSLVVSDNGCGIDEDTQGKLFEPFFTTKEVGKGTGLGLATVYGIVKQNDGFVNVASKPGQDTTFTIYLPRHAEQTQPLQQESTEVSISGGHETILVVEDERVMLEMATLMLQMHGYTVLSAAKPSEAIVLSEKYVGKIHLLMTDVIMPEMNGRDLAIQIQSLYPDVKLLFMSGYTADIIADHGVLNEGVNFIQKPFTKKNLTTKVCEVLEQI